MSNCMPVFAHSCWSLLEQHPRASEQLEAVARTEARLMHWSRCRSASPGSCNGRIVAAHAESGPAQCVAVMCMEGVSVCCLPSWHEGCVGGRLWPSTALTSPSQRCGRWYTRRPAPRRRCGSGDACVICHVLMLLPVVLQLAESHQPVAPSLTCLLVQAHCGASLPQGAA